MKKFVTGILVLALVLSVSSTTVFAAGGRHGRRAANVDKRNDCGYYNADCQFVDSDGDGLCDLCGLGANHAGKSCGANYIDEDGDGICDLCGREAHSAGQGCGANYIDEDGDGLCDRCGLEAHPAAEGCGANYTDEDGDGVCDNKAAGTGQKGCGLRRGRCGERSRFCR